MKLYKKVMESFSSTVTYSFNLRQVLDILQENQSPISRNVDYDQEIDVQIESLREAIMLNCHANQSLKDFPYRKRDMQPFLAMFTDKPPLQDRELLYARLILFLHLSNS
jgi:hypothetical protein